MLNIHSYFYFFIIIRDTRFSQSKKPFKAFFEIIITIQLDTLTTVLFYYMLGKKDSNIFLLLHEIREMAGEWH